MIVKTDILLTMPLDNLLVACKPQLFAAYGDDIRKFSDGLKKHAMDMAFVGEFEARYVHETDVVNEHLEDISITVSLGLAWSEDALEREPVPAEIGDPFFDDLSEGFRDILLELGNHGIMCMKNEAFEDLMTRGRKGITETGFTHAAFEFDPKRLLETKNPEETRELPSVDNIVENESELLN